jgi:hypothetical protein
MYLGRVAVLCPAALQGKRVPITGVSNCSKVGGLLDHLASTATLDIQFTAMNSGNEL